MPTSNSRLLYLFQERLGERTISADAVFRDVVGLRRVDDDHALRAIRARIALHLERDPSVGNADRADEFFCQRIVAAGVEHHDLDARRELQRRLDVVDRRHFVAHAQFVLKLGVDGHQIILAFELHAVAGVIEQRRIRRLGLARELRDGLIHLPLLDVEFQSDIESDRPQRLRDVGGVVARVGQGGRVRVVCIADDERYPPVRRPAEV